MLIKSHLFPASALTFLMSITTCQADEPNADNAALNALTSIFSVDPIAKNQATCAVHATADFAKYIPKLETFRQAWLNRDYSIDFYNQRRKQVFAFLIAKRYGELMTEGLFNSQVNKSPPEKCDFSIDVKALDKFGNEQIYPVATWQFDKALGDKVSWEKFDPRDFQSIALNYRISDKITAWISDEPPFGHSNNEQKDNNNAGCDVKFLKANATFIRATTYCQRDFMDSPAGYYALAMSRQCNGMPEAEVRAVTMKAMKELDRIAKSKGVKAACTFVFDLEKAISIYVTKQR